MTVTTTYSWQIDSFDDFLLNNPTNTLEEQPAVTAAANGTDFLAAWVTHAFNDSVRARIGDHSGQPSGSELDPSAGLTVFQQDPALATLHNGNYVVAFGDNDPATGGVRVRLLDSHGAALGNETLLSINNPNFGDLDPDVTVLNDGHFVVTWTRWWSATDTDIHFAMFNENGTLQLSTSVNTAIDVAEMSSVTSLANGGFVVAWQSHTNANTGVYFRMYDASGVPTDGTPIAGVLIDHFGDNTDIQLAGLPDGGFVAVYTDTGWGISGSEISGRIFNADGSQRGNVFLVNSTYTAGNEDKPSITLLSNGDFAVSWHDPVDALNIAAFDAQGHAVGAPAVIVGQAIEGEIAGLNDGHVELAFESTVPDIASEAIRSDMLQLVRTINGDDDWNSLTGDSLHDVMHGAGGNDVLEGGGGADLLDGADGADAAAYDSAPTGVIASLADPSKNTGDAKGDQYISIENLRGSQFDDTLEGDNGANYLQGGGGNDTLIGNGGDDTLDGGQGQNTLYGGEGNDQLNSFNGNDKLYGDGGNDTLYSFGGNCLMAGGGGDDIYYALNSVGDTIVELPGEGHDAIYEGLVNYALPDNVEDLHLDITSAATVGTGNEFDNLIEGNQNANTLKGLGGNDTLIGVNQWNGDILDGGDGDDTAQYFETLDKYTLSDLGNHITLIRAGSPKADTLLSIEHIKVADGTINVVDGDPLFDTVYYMTHNLDVFHAGANAHDHYFTAGWLESRDPNAFFDTSAYLGTYKDAAASGMNPLTHYDQIGWKLGHDPAANFDTKLYLVHNPDVAAAGIDPLAHFLQYGMAEGRQAYQAIGATIVNGFDAEYYLMHNPDVAASGVDPLAHFQQFGWHEGRNPNGWFDTAGYLAHYGDVAASGINPLDHYETTGWKEGRDPSAGFDTLGYLAANPDVAAAGINPLDHFLQNGIYEGRAAVNDGMWH